MEPFVKKKIFKSVYVSVFLCSTLVKFLFLSPIFCHKNVFKKHYIWKLQYFVKYYLLRSVNLSENFFFLNCDMGDFSNPFLHLTKTRKKFVSKRRKRYIFSLKFWKIKENFLKRLNFCCCCICLYMWVFLDRILTGFLKINCDIIETDVKY